MQQFIKLKRVSTGKQAENRLGLDSQDMVIENYVKSVGGKIIHEVEEILSGGFKERITGNVNLDTLLKKRPQLKKAIELCEQTSATLIAKEASRISRHPLLIEYLINRGVNFIAADSPEDNALMIRLKSAINSEELVKISERTKAALEQRKIQLSKKGYFISKKGIKCRKLGSNNFINYKDRTAQTQRLRERWDNNDNVKIAYPHAKILRDTGKTFTDIANFLNNNGIKTAKGKDYTKSHVHNLLKKELTYVKP